MKRRSNYILLLSILAYFVIYIVLNVVNETYYNTEARTKLAFVKQKAIFNVTEVHDETSSGAPDVDRPMLLNKHQSDKQEEQPSPNPNCINSSHSLKSPVQLLHNVLLYKSRAKLSGKERKEVFVFQENFVEAFCESPTEHFPVVIGSKATISVNVLPPNQLKATLSNAGSDILDGYVVAVIRNEFANPYWTIMDVFDIFHIIQDINIPKARVLWLDAHPYATMDPLWEIYFGKPYQFSTFPFTGKNGSVFFPNMVLRYDRSKSVFMGNGKELQYSNKFAQFREEAYSKLGLNPKPRNCNALKLSVVWRRNYVSHPGNLQGKIYRKISNEKEVLESIGAFDNIVITEVLLENLTVSKQIETMSGTDIFFAMHGAGHSLVVFMPPGGLVVELTIPTKKANPHMKHIAVNSQLSFIKHVVSKTSSDGTSHYVEPSDVTKVIRNAISQLCHKVSS